MSKHDLADLAGDLYVLKADLEAMAGTIRDMVAKTEDRDRLGPDGDRLQVILSLLELRCPQVQAWAHRADDGDIALSAPKAEKKVVDKIT